MESRGIQQRRGFFALMNMLMEEALYENLDNPEKLKVIRAKLGIGKANPISDDDLKKIIEKATRDGKRDSPTIAAMAKYYADVKDIRMILTYMDKLYSLNTKLDYNTLPTFIKFTEKVDAIETAKSGKDLASSFSIETTPPDFQTKDGRYKVYEANSREDCIKYGNGYTFCISTLKHGNMYSVYRRRQESKYYFVFDTALKPDHNQYITVVDAQPTGKYEFTHKDNTTKDTSEKYDNSLDKFLQTKPGLAELKSVFKPVPMTAEEHEMITYFQDVEVNEEFPHKALTPEQLTSYIEWGFEMSYHLLPELNDNDFGKYVSQHGDIPLGVFNGRPKEYLKRFFQIIEASDAWHHPIYCGNKAERKETVLILGRDYKLLPDMQKVFRALTDEDRMLMILSIPDSKFAVSLLPKHAEEYADDARFVLLKMDKEAQVSFDDFNPETLRYVLKQPLVMYKLLMFSSFDPTLFKYLEEEDIFDLLKRLQARERLNANLISTIMKTHPTLDKTKLIAFFVADNYLAKNYIFVYSRGVLDDYAAFGPQLQDMIAVKCAERHPEVQGEIEHMIKSSKGLPMLERNPKLLQFIPPREFEYALRYFSEHPTFQERVRRLMKMVD